MTSQTELTIFLLLCFIAASFILLKSWKKEISSSLTIFYIVNLLLIHFIGALIYILPWYEYGDIDTTLKGFRIATYGIIAFGIGNLMLAPYFMRFFSIKSSNSPTPRLPNPPKIFAVSNKSLSNLPKMYLLIGIVSYFVLFTFIARIPTLRALISVGQQLMVIGICLACWKAWIEKNKRRLITYLFLSLSFPFVTIIIQGFLGYGTIMTLTILLFTAKFFRPKWKVIIAGVLIFYLGLTFYQGYMRDRGELRDTIWGGAPVIERIEELSTTLINTEWFNPFDVKQLGRIDDRLNQNYLVGKAVGYLKGGKDYAYGETLWESIIALVPRIIWREKPVYAGSGDIVSNYTGLKFAPGTSVGVGQVMEFYINFGNLGVIFGFLILGIIIGIIDVMAGYNLLKGNWQRFALWMLPGLAFLQVGGSLVEVTSSAGAGLVVAYLASRLRSSHYPVILALIYLIFVAYLTKPYLEIIIPIVIIAIVVKKYLLPTLRKVIRSVSH